MSLYERVPDIDLSPEFSDAPLSALHPRDAARLLADMLYYPQRVRDYVLRFARGQRGESPSPRSWQPRAWLAWLEQSPVQADFLLLAALLLVVGIALLVNGLGFASALVAGQAPPFGAIGAAMLLGILAALVVLGVGVAGDEAGALVPFALPVGVGVGLVWLAAAAAPLYGLHEGRGGLAFLGAMAGLAFGAGAAALFASASLGMNSLRTQAALAALVGPAVGVAVGFAGWPAPGPERPGMFQLLFGDVLVLALWTATGFLAGALRPDDYLLHARRPGLEPAPADWLALARVTPLPLPHLFDHVTAWLDFDWARGMDNAASLWWYTAQQETVRRALHEVLQGDRAPVAAGTGVARDEKQSDRVVEIVARIADAPQRYPWDMVTYEHPARAAIVRAQPVRDSASRAGSAYLQRRQKRQKMRQRALQAGLAPALPLKTPEQAVTAGFWYLDRGHIADARAALRKAPASPLAREMQSILDALNTLSSEENLLLRDTLALPERPKEPKRPAVWEGLDTVRESVRFARLARQAIAPPKRLHAFRAARRRLRTLIEQPNPAHVELRHLQKLAELWEADLNQWFAAHHPPQPLKPVENPFIFTEPLRRGPMFVDRARERAELKLAWNPNNLQPVLLCGPSRIGKTSLLYLARAASPQVELAWFHVGHAGRERAGLPQLLAALCAAVQEATVLDVATPEARPLSAAAIERAADPYAETERFLRQICGLLLPRTLVLVLDDFDALAALLQGLDGGGPEPPTGSNGTAKTGANGGYPAAVAPRAGALELFLGFLEHLFLVVKNFDVVFVSQRPPIALEPYFRARFAGTLRPLVLGPLQPADVATLLRPAALPLYVTDEGVERALDLCGGQPYLLQRLGHTAVQRFNRLAAEGKGEPLLESEEIEAAAVEADIAPRAMPQPATA